MGRVLRRGISHYFHGSGVPRNRDAFEAGAATATPTAPEPLPSRTHHPVVEPDYRRKYRVIRRFLVNDHLGLEDIGYFNTAMDGFALLRTELGRAVLFDPNGKQVSDNLQPIERRD